MHQAAVLVHDQNQSFLRPWPRICIALTMSCLIGACASPIIGVSAPLPDDHDRLFVDQAAKATGHRASDSQPSTIAERPVFANLTTTTTPPPQSSDTTKMSELDEAQHKKVADAQPAVDTAEDGTLWPRLRRGFTIPPLPDNLTLPARHRWGSRVTFIERSLSRGADFLPFILDELSRRGMPAELALLPVLESGFQAHALSTANASGPWQFIGSTGREFGLHDNTLASGRKDWKASTRAALDYLAQLNKRFQGNWHLALAAYNAGPGTVSAAMGRASREGYAAIFENLLLPEETRQYVPALLAIAAMVASPQRTSLQLPFVADRSALVDVPLKRDIDLRRLAHLAGMPEDRLLRFNPAMKPPLVVASLTPNVVLPEAAASRLQASLARARGPLASWSVHVTRQGETLAAVAKKYQISVAELRALNAVPQGRAPARGAALLVPRSASAGEVPLQVAVVAALPLEPVVRARKSRDRRVPVDSGSNSRQVRPG